jgi:predicted phosphate transport protein (TIGR00153 family)
MRLLPKANHFFDELEQHSQLIVQSAQILLESVHSSGDLGDAARRIREIERQCDQITRNIVLELHKTFITPLDRLDTHDLIKRLDDVMDAVEQAAYCLSRYKKGQIPSEVKELVTIAKSAADKLSEGIRLLRDLKAAEQLLGICNELRGFETRSDEISRDVVARLFDDVPDAAALLKWKEIYETLELITDRSNDVADVLENIVLDNA